MPEDKTPHGELRYLWTGQAKSHGFYNDNSIQVEMGLVTTSVISRTTTSEPGSPSEGDRYAITGAGSGTNWTGHTDELAEWVEDPNSETNFSWYFKPFFEGLCIWDEGAAGGAEEAIWNGSSWTVTFT